MTRVFLICTALLFGACGDDGANNDAGVLPDCSTIQPPSDHPSGSCQAGAVCGHPPPEGWSCSCSAQNVWSCQFIGQSPHDMSHPISD
jgi:hypothetical protein